MDYWEDEGLGETTEIASGLSDADWSAFTEGWRDKSSEWQRRLAQVSSEVRKARSLEMLLAMLDSDDADIVVSAADALRSYPSEGWSAHVTDAHLDRLRQVAGRSTFDARIVRELLRHVPRGEPSGEYPGDRRKARGR